MVSFTKLLKEYGDNVRGNVDLRFGAILHSQVLK